MPRRKLLLALILALSLPGPFAHAAKKPYVDGKFIDIQQKTRDRVDMYLVNTPVTTAVPYFQIAVEIGNMDYVAEYTPRHSGEELPEVWKPGETVQSRVEKHHLYLQRPEGTEMQWIITRRTPVDKEKSHE